jgi:hypothetical protein
MSAAMLKGEEVQGCRVGNPENRRELGELLASRAELLNEFAEDDDAWDG